MTSNSVSVDLSKGVQSLSSLLTIITANETEEQVIDHSSGPIVMGSSLLGYAGQLGLIRAAIKLAFGLSTVHGAKLDVNTLKCVTCAPIDNVAHGIGFQLGLNPRYEQPLLNDFLSSREWPTWYYFGSRPSKEQQRQNKKISNQTLFFSILFAFATGATAVPLAYDQKFYYWLLIMLNPLGLFFLAIVFVKTRGSISPADDGEIAKNGLEEMKPVAAIFLDTSIGFIDQRALEFYPTSLLFVKICFLVGSGCLTVGFVAAFALLDDTKWMAFLWIALQVFLVIVRYVLWFTRPYCQTQYISSEMGARSMKVLSSLNDFKTMFGQEAVICIAAARLKEFDHELQPCDAIAVRSVLPKLEVNEKMFLYQDLDKPIVTQNVKDTAEHAPITIAHPTQDLVTTNPVHFVTMRHLQSRLHLAFGKILKMVATSLAFRAFTDIEGQIGANENAEDTFAIQGSKRRFFILPWTICYAMSRALGLPGFSEPWTGRHNRLCAVVEGEKVSIVICITVDTILKTPDPKNREYVLVGEKENGEIDFCSQMVYKIRPEELLIPEKSLLLLRAERLQTSEIFRDAESYLKSAKEWRDALLQTQKDPNENGECDLEEDLANGTLRRLIVRNATSLDINVRSADVQVDQFWSCRNIA